MRISKRKLNRLVHKSINEGRKRAVKEISREYIHVRSIQEACIAEGWLDDQWKTIKHGAKHAGDTALDIIQNPLDTAKRTWDYATGGAGPETDIGSVMQELIDQIKLMSKIRGGSSGTASDSAPHLALKPSDVDPKLVSMICTLINAMGAGGSLDHNHPMFNLLKMGFLDQNVWFAHCKPKAATPPVVPPVPPVVPPVPPVVPKPRPCGQRASKGWSKYCSKGSCNVKLFEYWQELVATVGGGMERYDASWGSFVKFYNNIRNPHIKGRDPDGLAGMTVNGVEIVPGKQLSCRQVLKVMEAIGEGLGAMGNI